MEEDSNLLVSNYPDPQDGFNIAFLKTTPEAEVVAALGASLSRDPASLESRASGMTPEKGKQLVSRYFRSYGHSSIGEMGNMFLAIERISGVVAQTTIDFSRFQGQEASSRYIDLTESGYLLPPQLRDNEEAHLIVQTQMGIYKNVLDACLKQFTDEGMAEKEARPRALDIAGAFLPGAYRTSVCMSVDIRTVVEHVWRLQSHLDSSAVREVGDLLYTVIDIVCPNSIKKQTKKNLKNLYLVRKEIQKEEYIQTKFKEESGIFFDTELFNLEGFKRSVCSLMLESRLLPDMEVGFFGTIRASFSVSFRTYRDIARHRLFAKSFFIDPACAVAPWYVEEENAFLWDLSQSHADFAQAACSIVKTETDLLHLLPMGTQLRVSMAGNVGMWLYFLQLRSKENVHPELRLIVQELARLFGKALSVSPDRLANMENPSPGDYLRRSKDA